MVSENPAGDVPVSRAAAASPGRTGGRSGRHGRPSALRPSAVRAAVGARLEETPFSRGIVLMVTAGLVLVVVVVGTVVALTAGGSGGKEPRAAAPPPAAPTSADPGPTGHSPRAHVSHRRPKTSSSTMVGPIPRPTTAHPAAPSTSPATPSWWPPHDGRPHWHYTSPPPWWHHH